jgi:VWFA-related protein
MFGHRGGSLLARLALVTLICSILDGGWAISQINQTASPQPATQGTQAPKPPGNEPERPTFKVQSNLVVVDVTARDKKGTLIRGLKKEDFTVYEDNVAQQIVTFSQEDIPAAPAAAADTVAETNTPVPAAVPVNFSTTPRNERKQDDLENKRLIILFFDLSSLTTEDLIRSLNTAEDYVAKKSTPHDLISIATYSSILQIPQDFTNDHSVLLQALKRLGPTEAGDAPQDDLSDSDSGSDDVYVPDTVQFNIFNTDRRLSSVETLAKMYREYRERKSLIYFSSGLTTTGVENESQIRSAIDTVNKSNMSIYTVDSRGLVALPPSGDATRSSPGGRALFSGSGMSTQTSSLSSSQETLTTLAHDTGGTAFQDTNDLAPVFDKVVNDNQIYYVLGYYSANLKEDGRFRRIRVEVRSPDIKLQHRPGYFASKQFLRLTQTERDRQLEEALAVDRPFSDLPFILEANYFKDENNTNVVPVSLQLAGEGVQFEEKGNRREGQFEFLAQITDPKGKVAGIARDTVQVRLPVQTAEKIKAGQILYTTGFQLRPGDYKLKFLIRDNRSGKLGSFEEVLTVPVLDGKSLQVSSVVLGSRLVDAKQDSQGVEHRGIGDRFRLLGVKRDPLIIDDKRIVPSIGNVFLSRQTLYVYFQVYGAADDPQTKKPSLETYLMLLQNKTKVRESQPYAVSAWDKDNKGVVSVTMAVPLRGLKKGAYTLQLHLRDEASDTNLFRQLPIVIN